MNKKIRQSSLTDSVHGASGGSRKFIMGGKIFKLTNEAYLTLGLRFYGGQIYSISSKFIII